MNDYFNDIDQLYGNYPYEELQNLDFSIHSSSLDNQITANFIEDLDSDYDILEVCYDLNHNTDVSSSHITA